ncbi:hypothetical protein FQN57_005297 [Myotisia sp. PD_48]|nr:hypothetical protein FQN57_005297 [Myotisia sp. PD_48]
MFLRFILALWRSAFPPPCGNPGRENARNVKWLDGLRGIASFLVILTHLARAWDYDLFNSKTHEHLPPRILQLPILRLPWQGRLGVTIFAFLTGYVCALKPLKLSRGGNYMAAYTSITKSAFRRPPRLIFPATIAMAIAWVLAQFGAFKVGNRCDSGWIRYSSVQTKDTLWGEVMHFFHEFFSVWSNGQMDYDDHQWALRPLLRVSMAVYVTLCATMYVKFHYRILIYTGMILFFHQNPAPDSEQLETFGQQAFYGMLLCDLANHQPSQSFISSFRWTRRLFCFFVIFTGLFVASFPAHKPEWCGWSNYLLHVSQYIFPPNVSLPKRWSALGVDMVILGIFISPGIKNVLSNRFFLYFGRNSFAVYLTHGTLLRTVLTWMLHGSITGEPWVVTKNEKGEFVNPPFFPAGSRLRFTICIPIWIGLVYIVAHLWTNHVDTFCARLTQKIENRFFESEDEKSQLPK